MGKKARRKLDRGQQQASSARGASLETDRGALIVRVRFIHLQAPESTLPLICRQRYRTKTSRTLSVDLLRPPDGRLFLCVECKVLRVSSPLHSPRGQRLSSERDPRVLARSR